MYRHILIPTDGSELAEHGVTNGLSLAKFVGAKVTVIVVEEPFNWLSVSETQAQRALVRQTYRADQEARCERAEPRGQCGQAGRRALRHIQVENAQPYQAIIATAAHRGCDLLVWHRTGAAGYPQLCSVVSQIRC